jgi:hypothetical protein
MTRAGFAEWVIDEAIVATLSQQFEIAADVVA